ncbi:hypothetical protein C8R45DRAFT_946446 [Mycena sanguinolenta]|nr:hypothetical protein C8R45DRAFT_946446 [Mycena sanguinolenta]
MSLSNPVNKELDMVFHFELVNLDLLPQRKPLIYHAWKLSEFTEIINCWQTCFREEGFWNTIGDHLGGTHYVFQGQKIGMRNFPRSWGISEYKDINSQNFYQEQVASFVPQLYQLIVWASRILANCHLESGGKAEDAIDMSDVLDSLQKKARDHGCIPMQWDSSAHGGFTTVMFQPGPEATKPRLFGSASQAQAEPTYGPEPAFGPAWQSSRPRPSLKAAASVVLMLKFVNVNAKLGSSFGPIVFREGAGPEGQIFADFELYFLSGFW